jgi:hypothetical protein
MILLNFEWTLLRSNIYWWLVFLLIVPLKALANCQRSYWCINFVNDTGNACIAGVGWRYLLPSINDTGDVWRHRCQDTGDMLRRRRMHASPVSMTPVNNFLTVSLTPVKLSKTVKVSLTGVVDTGEETPK